MCLVHQRSFIRPVILFSPTSCCGPDIFKAGSKAVERINGRGFCPLLLISWNNMPSTSALERNVETGNIRNKQIPAEFATKFWKLQIEQCSSWQQGCYCIKASVALGVNCHNGFTKLNYHSQSFSMSSAFSLLPLSAFFVLLFSSVLLQSVCSCEVWQCKNVSEGVARFSPLGQILFKFKKKQMWLLGRSRHIVLV